jgi:carotenoid cleavage dioxygenase-like enzyme
LFASLLVVSQPVTSFWEHRIHRTTGAVTRRLLSKQSMDHPIVNPAFYGTAHRFAFFPNCVIPAPHEQSGPPQGWTRLDIETGEKQTVYFGPKFFTEGTCSLFLGWGVMV